MTICSRIGFSVLWIATFLVPAPAMAQRAVGIGPTMCGCPTGGHKPKVTTCEAACGLGSGSRAGTGGSQQELMQSARDLGGAIGGAVGRGLFGGGLLGGSQEGPARDDAADFARQQYEAELRRSAEAARQVELSKQRILGLLKE